MFDLIVFWLLALILFLATGAAINMGLFRADRPGRGLAYKTLAGLCSYAFSGAAWYFMYSYHYLGW